MGPAILDTVQEVTYTQTCAQREASKDWFYDKKKSRLLGGLHEDKQPRESHSHTPTLYGPSDTFSP